MFMRAKLMADKTGDHNLTSHSGVWKDCTEVFLRFKYRLSACIYLCSSTVIEHMKAYSSSKPKHAVSYFYFDFNDTEKQNATNCASSLIAQLCSQVPDLPEKL